MKCGCGHDINKHRHCVVDDDTINGIRSGYPLKCSECDCENSSCRDLKLGDVWEINNRRSGTVYGIETELVHITNEDNDSVTVSGVPPKHGKFRVLKTAPVPEHWRLLSRIEK